MQSIESLCPAGSRSSVFELGFCTIAVVSENTAEVVIHEGVEVSESMVDQCLDVLRASLQVPFCLLVNECHSHSYDFHAQMALGRIDEVLAVALVSDKPLMDMAACSLMRLPRPTRWPMAVFSSRDDALALLNAMQRDDKERPDSENEFSLKLGTG
jgi:hypothetical protein